MTIVENTNHRIISLTLDEHGVVRRSVEIEQERQVAIHDLIAENYFKLVDGFAGPFVVQLKIIDNRLQLLVQAAENATRAISAFAAATTTAATAATTTAATAAPVMATSAATAAAMTTAATHMNVDLTSRVRQATIELPLSPFRTLVRDYFMICDSYYSAVKSAPPHQIETIDMARRGIHSEGANLLMERLLPKVEIDSDTARRLFTLVCVLHLRSMR